MGNTRPSACSVTVRQAAELLRALKAGDSQILHEELERCSRLTMDCASDLEEERAELLNTITCRMQRHIDLVDGPPLHVRLEPCVKLLNHLVSSGSRTDSFPISSLERRAMPAPGFAVV